MRTIAVLGAGNSGLAMSAHLALAGHPVRLWNRSLKNIIKLQKTNLVHCTGTIEGTAQLQLVTDNMEDVLDGVELVLVTTPADSHRDIAERMAQYLTDRKTVVLNPGRTFGVIEMKHVLCKHQAPVMPVIAETQTIIYTCRKISEDSVVLLSLKKDVFLSACTRADTEKVLNQFPSCLLKFFLPADNLLRTSLGNVGAILHCLPVLLNSGWIENNKVDFKYYYDGITPTIANYLEKLDAERLNIARQLGVELESVADWMRRSYRIGGNNLYECIQNNVSYKTIDAPRSLRHRYIFEDIPCGLVAFESLGKLVGLDLRYIPQVIDLATKLLDFDFRANGRTLERLGIRGATVQSVLQVLTSGFSL